VPYKLALSISIFLCSLLLVGCNSKNKDWIQVVDSKGNIVAKIEDSQLVNSITKQLNEPEEVLLKMRPEFRYQLEFYHENKREVWHFSPPSLISKEKNSSPVYRISFKNGENPFASLK